MRRSQRSTCCASRMPVGSRNGLRRAQFGERARSLLTRLPGRP
jgi:hypothetical protein